MHCRVKVRRWHIEVENESGVHCAGIVLGHVARALGPRAILDVLSRGAVRPAPGAPAGGAAARAQLDLRACAAHRR